MNKKFVDKFPNVSIFMDNVGDEYSNLNPIYRRNFRALLQSIPIFGVFIDANVTWVLEDSSLEQRLFKLEVVCKNVLMKEAENLLLEDFIEINMAFTDIMLTHQGKISKDHDEIKELLKVIVQTQQPEIVTPNSSFHFIIISGASAVGKDALIELLDNDFFPNHPRCELLTKVTTRDKRPTESRYYKFLTDNELKNWSNENRILFPYSKREFKYGFDKFYFSNCIASDTLLFCVFTEFSMLPKTKKKLQDQGINVVSILLEAPEKHLHIRSLTRSLPQSEVQSRLRSIKKDLQYIEYNRKEIEDVFDYIIYNGDDRAKCDTYKELRSIVCSY